MSKILFYLMISALMIRASFGQQTAKVMSDPDTARFKVHITVYVDRIKTWGYSFSSVAVNGGPWVSADSTGKLSVMVKKGDILTVKGMQCSPKTVKIRKRVDSLKVRIWMVEYNRNR